MTERAQRLQITKLYAATHSAVRTFERAGWLGFDQVLHEGETLTVFAKRVAQRMALTLAWPHSGTQNAIWRGFSA